jgi:hypothetical protein
VATRIGSFASDDVNVKEKGNVVAVLNFLLKTLAMKTYGVVKV